MTLLLSRWQFGIATVFHFIFVPLTIPSLTGAPGEGRPRSPGPDPAHRRPGRCEVRRQHRAGVAAALCTVGLLACSGALIDKAALRPPSTR